jgi:ATP-dependent protease ClpP protease subunit
MKLSYRTQANAHAIAAIYNKSLDNKEWFKVIAAKNDNEESEILLFDYVGWPYNDPRDFIQAISGMDNILLRINSLGGDVFDGAAIYNALASHKGNVTTRIEGIAASIASVITMAGKKVQAFDNTMLMIHNAWTIAAGNQYEFAELSEFLAKVDNEIIMGAYQNKTKKSKKEISSMMKDTTYMSAKEAKEHGFVDEIVTGKSVKAEYDLSIFGKVPDTDDYSQGRELTRKETERALRNAGASREYARAIAAKRADASDEVDPPVIVPPVIVPPQDTLTPSIIAALKSNINILTGGK